MAFKLAAALLFLLLWAIASSQTCTINNVCFAIDESGSISDTQFANETDVVLRVASAIEMISTKRSIQTQYAAIDFGATESTVSSLTDLATFKERVRLNTHRKDPDTRYAPAFERCGSVLSGASGVRAIVLLTDGAPSDTAAAIAAASALKNMPNTFVITVGVGLTSSGASLLQSLASGPSFYADADSFSALKVGEVVQAICPKPKCPKSNFCRFRLTSGGTIQRKGNSFIVGVVGGSREASVLVGGSFVQISQWSPAGLRQNFSPSFFKTFALAVPSMRSGVGYETPQQNQNEFIDLACVRLPFAAYQILNSAGFVIDNVNTNSPRDCVEFQADFPSAYDQATQTGR
mmetsp:Transcript_18237/g.38087  ORF Transcript_18237/g.38087 Transcript_18237/m.38087 type:complete len:348 (-) Transcript_18237:390-1433(-)|eukprot:CAMPEP_0184681694 /NCGR_PEP_ID=MMETSP0312-20130426/4679_1 /TAXON_ID=31354 /ORGANISM="Compsopogon coeruleus, Strain SAG 36.94" /LENGTH=347 /DNA_ID=CAMNT_0027132695 /DNA_START=231 /DNA_END=1274 /DNA_ORIENTATION=-